MKVLCVGDIFGPKGVRYAAQCIKELHNSHNIDYTIANIENSALGGRGPSEHAITLLKEVGVDVFTGGNHSFDNNKMYYLYDEHSNLLRPINFYHEAPGKGLYIIKKIGKKDLYVINIQLRVFMREMSACPFAVIDKTLALIPPRSLIIIDMHGEATSEKLCFGDYCDGRVSAIFGTHTHVQTADARILPKGTGYITDVGMVGALHSSIGKTFSSVIRNLITQMPGKMEDEEEGEYVFSAIIFDITAEGTCCDIERIYWVENNIV